MISGVSCMVRGEILPQPWLLTRHATLTDLDRPIEFGPWPEVKGGQVWTQTAFPCFSDFVVFLGCQGFVLVNNPTYTPGNIALQWRGPPWEISFTSEELQDYLHKHHYHYEGQLYDLILSQWHEALCTEPPAHD